MFIQIFTPIILLLLIGCQGSLNSKNSKKNHYTNRTEPASIKLRFIGDINFPTSMKYKNIPLGGLSGLDYIPKTKTLWAVSDDRTNYAPARMYQFDLQLTKNSLKLTPKNQIFLKNRKGKIYKKNSTDFEGIALLPSGNILLTSETTGSSWRKKHTPAIIKFKKNGDFVSNIVLPDFLIHERKKKNRKKGIRENEGLENLTAVPSSQIFYTAAQEAIKQDGPKSDHKNGSLIRIIKYKNDIPIAAYPYYLSPTPFPPTLKKKFAPSHSVSDMLAIDEHNIIVIEKSYSPVTHENVVKLFLVTIEKDTTDILETKKLPIPSLRLVRKQLIANLNDFLPKFSKGFQKLDNIEGISFGPTLPGNSQTLILVSDNNFNPHQRTLFLAFEIVKATH